MKSLATLRTIAVAALLSVPLAAQLPDWVALPSSSPTRLFAESTIVVVEDAAGFHVYSSYTRAWSNLTVGAGAAFYGFDDHCIIVDGTTAYGFATRDGKWSTRQLSGAPLVVQPSSGAVWVTALIDGNDVHVFSGLLGTWTDLTFATTPNVAVARMVAVASDGVRTIAVSAEYGTPTPLGLRGITSIDAVGYCGVARDAGAVHVFSAARDRWRSVIASPTAALLKPPSRAGYVVVQETDRTTFVSALSDTQVMVLHGPQATLRTEANVAALQDGNALHAYSCSAGTIDTVTSAVGWSAVDVKQEIVVATDPTNVHAFGMLAGRFAPALTGGHVVLSDTGVALATSVQTGAVEAFSCMTNAWAAAPTGNFPLTYTTYNGAILVDASGTLHGFSANRGTWTTQNAPIADAYFKNKAAFCARSGTRLDAFNGRTGQWATTTTAAPATVTCFDMAVMADDGQDVHCYSCYRDAWSSHPCVTTQSQLRDECAYFHDGTNVLAWSGSSQVAEFANMPEYWRVLSRGGRLHYNVAGEPGAAALLAVGPLPADLPTPFGTLRVDPNAAFAIPLQIPQFGTATFALTIPDNLSLRGITLYAQGVIGDPVTGRVYLTEYFESTIL